MFKKFLVLITVALSLSVFTTACHRHGPPPGGPGGGPQAQGQYGGPGGGQYGAPGGMRR
ncbi:MAG: hypothetical protein LUC43_02290 [Burkholderiales bacterium]|nr:hypothetical protein [Burkholderiales bacterium]